MAQNVVEAAKWWKLAADQGHAEAQWRLGMCSESGRGVEFSYAEAIKWYRKAADQGHPKAPSCLERLLENRRSLARRLENKEA